MRCPQVATLQRQVEGLVARREAQEQEIAALRMGLAAQHDAGGPGREAQQVGAWQCALLCFPRLRLRCKFAGEGTV